MLECAAGYMSAGMWAGEDSGGSPISICPFHIPLDGTPVAGCMCNRCEELETREGGSVLHVGIKVGCKTSTKTVYI